MKTKNFFYAALAVFALASCVNDEYVGENAPSASSENQAIGFGSGFNAVTRADITGSEAATKLGSAMKVYGVKQNRTTTTNYDDVFVNYSVKYSTAQAANDEYNAGWYYVAAETGQTIKYWDWASANYHFVAGSPVANFTYTKNGTTGDIESATVANLGGRLNHTTSVAYSVAPNYIADAKVVAKADYNAPVSFTFRSMQSKVRVGIYETVPGYSISSIQFYNNDDPAVASNYITLNSATADYFQGGSAVTGTVTYDWTTPEYTFAYGTDVTSAKYWEGGQYTSGVPATTSTAATLWGASIPNEHYDDNGYFVVMPTPSATVAAPLTLTCDYTLTAEDGHGETIVVKGATATIPSAYTKWNVNTAYTYIFKISDNTNGKTDPSQPNSGLYPITFDAVVVNTADGMVGTETTVSTPSITASQDGFVVTEGITYKAGAITLTAMNGTEDVTGSPTTWFYVELASAYDYSKDYERLGDGGAATSWTSGKLATLVSGKSYVVKVVTASGTAYLVINNVAA